LWLYIYSFKLMLRNLLTFFLLVFSNFLVGQAPTVAVSADKTTMSEAGTATYTATLSATSGSDVVVNLSLGGTAIEDIDFTTAFTNKGLNSTVAGITNSSGSETNKLNLPQGIHVDNSGNIYVADTYNYRIMKWAPDATNGTLVAGGNGQGAANNQLSNPNRVALDSSGNIYISDTGNNRIMKWEPDATEGTLVAGGNGSGGANAGSDTNKLDSPRGIHVDSSGNIYVSDYNNHRIMKWAPGASDGTLVAGGNGIGSELNKTSNPTDVHVDPSGNIFITEVGTLSASARVVKWTPGASEGIKVAAGSDNRGLDFNSAGKMYVSEKSNHKVMKWTLGEDNGTVFIGGNVGSDSNQLNNPFAIHVDALGNLYTADYR
jgi:sugar lactone lactonase YvrE